MREATQLWNDDGIPTASELAYGAVSYLVMKNTDEQIHSSIVMAKSHLAPLKIITIPRLELRAAT